MLFVIIAISLSSCKLFQPVQISTPANVAVLNDVINLGKQCNSMYITMLQSDDKSFDTYVVDWNNGEVLISSIIAMDKARPNSRDILRQAELFQTLYIKYKNEHKTKHSLNNSEIRIYNDGLKKQLQPLIDSEMSLK